tara:strand:- start:1604 stop:1738 length:135 start_codon:yes stop_codon:yes gene_type:complete
MKFQLNTPLDNGTVVQDMDTELFYEVIKCERIFDNSVDNTLKLA